MDNLDIEGLFWLATNQDDKVAGHLKFDPADGAELNLSGSIQKLVPSTSEKVPVSFDDDWIRIHGLAGGHKITLDRCQLIKRETQFPEFARESYYSPIVLSGDYFFEGEPLEFSSASVHLLHLEHWVRRSSVTIRFDQDEESNGLERVHVTSTSLQKIATGMSDGTLELTFTYNLLGDHIVKSEIRQSCILSLQFAVSRPLADILGFCLAIQDLVTIGLDVPSRITGVSLERSNQSESLESDRGDSTYIQLYVRLRESNHQAIRKAPSTAEMLFTFDDVGGLDTIGKWIKVSGKFRIVIGALMNYWYVPGLTQENRFFNVITAAEALARIRTGEQNLNLEKELKNLAENAGDTFVALVGSVDSWANEIVRIRINNVVHRGLHETVDSFRLFVLSESVYFLVVLCLLRDCDVEEGTLASVRKSLRFERIARQLQGKSDLRQHTN